MNESGEELPVEDEFDPDRLDLKELESEVSLNEVQSLTGKIPPFLARLQWWGFGILVAFVLIIILRMIFGPPWIDRFRVPRLPVAIDSTNNLVGVIVPIIDEESSGSTSSFTLFLVDSGGGIRQKRKLGGITPGPLDLAMGKDSYYYIFGEGSWVAGRKYASQQDAKNLDIELNQFKWKLRDGIDLLRSRSGAEYLNVYSGDSLITLSRQGELWELFAQYKTSAWGEGGYEILDAAENHVLAQSGTAFFLLDFPDYVNGYEKFSEEYLLKELKQRPLFPGEFVYKPAWIIPAERPGGGQDCFILKNDRLFNLSYKQSDDQVFFKSVTERKIKPFTLPYFVNKDIRGMGVLYGNESSILGSEKTDASKRATLVILYEKNFDFRLAGLSPQKEKPLWDIYLGRSIAGL